MLPRTCMPPLAHGAARAAKWSQVLCGAAHSHTAALYTAAHLYVAAHPWCRACGQMVSVLHVAASHGAAQFSVCRVPCYRAVLHVAASHGAASHVAASHAAAQFSVLLR